MQPSLQEAPIHLFPPLWSREARLKPKWWPTLPFSPRSPEESKKEILGRWKRVHLNNCIGCSFSLASTVNFHFLSSCSNIAPLLCDANPPIWALFLPAPACFFAEPQPNMDQAASSQKRSAVRRAPAVDLWLAFWSQNLLYQNKTLLKRESKPLKKLKT